MAVTVDADDERVAFRARRPAQPGPAVLHAPLPRHAQRPAARLLPVDVQGRSRQRQDHRGHAIRVDERAPRVPVLGRARSEGDLLDHAGGRRRPDRARQHAADLRRADRRRSARASGSPTRCPSRPTWSPSSSASSRSPSRSTSTACRCGSFTSPARARSRRFAAECGAVRARTSSPSTSPSRIPTDKLDLVGVARLRRRRDGEPRPGDVPRGAAPRRSGDGHAGRGARDRERGRARDRPHVVRRPRDHAVVERPLAQGGVRDLHGAGLHRRHEARLARVGRVRARPHRSARDRRAREHAADRVPGALAARRRGHVRRPHLREGRGGPADARAVPRRGRVPCRRARVPVEARVREHREHRSLGRDRSSDERARAAHHGCLDLPGRVSARARLHPARTGSRCASASGGSSTPTLPDTTQWPVPLHIRQTAGGEHDEHPPSSRREQRRRPARGSRRGRARERGRPRLPASAVRSASARPARGPGPRGDVDDRALQPRRRRLGCGLAGEASTDGVPELARGFGDESTLPVWQALSAGLGFCDRLLDEPEAA